MNSGAQGSRRREKPRSEVSRALKAVSAPRRHSEGEGGTDAKRPILPLPTPAHPGFTLGESQMLWGDRGPAPSDKKLELLPMKW